MFFLGIRLKSYTIDIIVYLEILQFAGCNTGIVFARGEYFSYIIFSVKIISKGPYVSSCYDAKYI